MLKDIAIRLTEIFHFRKIRNRFPFLQSSFLFLSHS